MTQPIDPHGLARLFELLDRLPTIIPHAERIEHGRDGVTYGLTGRGGIAWAMPTTDYGALLRWKGLESGFSVYGIPMEQTQAAPPATVNAPQGVQITIKRPGEGVDGPWIWFDVHPERGVHLYSTVKDGVKLERRHLEVLSKAVTHLLEAEEVTLASVQRALGE